MNDKPDSEQVPDQVKPPPKWIQFFLVFNLAVLLGLFIWEIGGSSFKSDDELKQVREREKNDILAALTSNPELVNNEGKLSQVIEYRIDATDPSKWIHFRFADGNIFSSENISSGSTKWDIAFRRAKILTNGGATGKKGKVEVAVIGTTDFESVFSAPLEGYVADKLEANTIEAKSRPELDKWYNYDFWTHRLASHEIVYVLRTAGNHHIKMQIIDYYCGIVAGCYTIKYQYQGSESISFLE